MRRRALPDRRPVRGTECPVCYPDGVCTCGRPPGGFVDHDAWLEGVATDPSRVSAEPLPAVLGFPFAYAGAAVLFVGPTGGGRSSLIQAGLYDAARAGVASAYLGCEVVEEEWNARTQWLAEYVGDTVNGQLREQLAAIRYLDLAPTIARAWKQPERWAAGVASRYPILGIDPLSAVGSALGLDFDKANAEVVQFFDRLIMPLTRQGVTVLIADNIGHAADAKTRAKGGSAKGDRADVVVSCARSSNPVGLILKAEKVRSIRAPFRRADEWLFTRDEQVIERRTRKATGETTSAPFRPTAIMEKVSRRSRMPAASPRPQSAPPSKVAPNTST